MSERFLVIDDSTTIQKVIQLAFAPFDAEIVIANSYIEAINESNLSAPSLVIADASLPGIKGAEDYQRLQVTLNRVPFIILIGSYDGIDQQAFKNYGFENFLQKPFEAAALVKTAWQALGKEVPIKPSVKQSHDLPPPPPGSDLVPPPPTSGMSAPRTTPGVPPPPTSGMSVPRTTPGGPPPPQGIESRSPKTVPGTIPPPPVVDTGFPPKVMETTPPPISKVSQQSESGEDSKETGLDLNLNTPESGPALTLNLDDSVPLTKNFSLEDQDFSLQSSKYDSDGLIPVPSDMGLPLSVSDSEPYEDLSQPESEEGTFSISLDEGTFTPPPPPEDFDGNTDKVLFDTPIMPNESESGRPIDISNDYKAADQAQGLLEPFLREELARVVRETVEDYCERHFAKIAREEISRELKKLTVEKSRLLIDN